MSRSEKLAELSGLDPFEVRLASLLWPGLEKTMTVEQQADYFRRSWAQMPEMARLASAHRPVKPDKRVSKIYKWHDLALALPGAPDIWLQAADGKGLVKVDGDEGLYGISSDGAWWEPTGRADRPWVLAVDHPATEGVLLALLLCVGWWVATTVREDGIHIVRASRWGHARVEGEGPTLGRAAIATGTALGKWPGGGE